MVDIVVAMIGASKCCLVLLSSLLCACDLSSLLLTFEKTLAKLWISLAIPFSVRFFGAFLNTKFSLAYCSLTMD